jgi:ankyrin repeat protein
MQRKFSYVFMMMLISLICTLLVSPSLASIRDSEFLELCKKGSLQEITEAIYSGANVNARSEELDNTPLIMAAGSNPNQEVITALIEAGADITKRNSHGETPLMYAAAYNLNQKAVAAVITALVNVGDDVDAKDNVGRTPLIYAVTFINLQAVTTLLKLGADARVRDSFGMKPLEIAEVKKEFRNTEAIRKLREASR